MTIVTFSTNLDLVKRHVWDIGDKWRGQVPRVGDDIRFGFGHEGKSFALRVVAVTWDCSGTIVTVELHMQPGLESIREWEERMKRHLGAYAS